MNRFFKKLQSSKGETLIETLCAVLIVGTACGIFATMIVAATRINELALSADQKLHNELSAAEKHVGGSTMSTVTVSWTDGIGSYQDFKIKITGNSDQLMSYVWAVS